MASRQCVRLGLGLVVMGLVGGRRRARQRVTEARVKWDSDVFEFPRDRSFRQTFVEAADGTKLRVREYGDDSRPITVILAHGWTLSSELWWPQVAALSSHARIVTYDHRGHGGSGRPSPDSCTLAQLGADLGAVVDTCAPVGDVVLVGHSMGGMTIMHLAATRPELVQERVRGVVLVSTSAGDLARLDLGLPRPFGTLARLAGRRVMRAVASLEPWVNPDASVPAELWLLARHLNFGIEAPARLVDETLSVARTTPLGVVSDFYGALMAHDGAVGIANLAHTPVSIVVGQRDRLTPPQHSFRIRDALPNARFQLVPDAGHMVLLERPDTVSNAILAHVLADPDEHEASMAIAAGG